MGLLDSEAMKFIFSNTDYMKRKREDEIAGRVQGLIGSPLQPGAEDGLGLAGMPGQVEVPGTGLLGGQFGQGQAGMNQFGQRLMGIPGMAGAGTALMGNANNNMQAMARQQQGQQFGANNMSMYQKVSAGIERSKAKISQWKAAMDISQGRSEARDKKIMAIGDDFTKQAQQYMPAIEGAGFIDELLQNVGGDFSKLNGMDAQAVQSAFLTAIRPGEAQMEGDLRQLADAMGFKGKMEEMWQYITSDTAKRPEHLAMMANIIQKKASMSQNKLTGLQQRVEQAFGLDQTEMKQVGYRAGGNEYTPYKVDFDSAITGETQPGRNVNGGVPVGNGIMNTILRR